MVCAAAISWAKARRIYCQAAGAAAAHCVLKQTCVLFFTKGNTRIIATPYIITANKLFSETSETTADVVKLKREP